MLVIGCAPSSGSSLLSAILNRHSSIISGPETALFARPSLMTHWKRDRHLIFQKHWRKLRDHGWHRYRGLNWQDPFYPWSASEMMNLVMKADSYAQFMINCEAFLLDKSDSILWVEKTPSNVYSFPWIRQHLPWAQILLMIRNPYDTIASLVARGYSVLYACGLYLLHTSAAYQSVEEEKEIVKYEDLVTNPVETIKGLCDIIEQPFESKMLDPDNHNVKMKGWNYDESGPIESGGVGRFKKLNEEQKNEIIHCANSLRVNQYFRIIEGQWNWISIEGLCDQLNYQFYKPSEKNPYVYRHNKELFKEKWIRTFKLYSSNCFNFPFIYQDL